MFVFVKPQRQQHSHTCTLKHTHHVTDSESLIGPIKKNGARCLRLLVVTTKKQIWIQKAEAVLHTVECMEED